MQLVGEHHCATLSLYAFEQLVYKCSTVIYIIVQLVGEHHCAIFINMQDVKGYHCANFLRIPLCNLSKYSTVQLIKGDHSCKMSANLKISIYLSHKQILPSGVGKKTNFKIFSDRIGIFQLDIFPGWNFQILVVGSNIHPL